MAEDWRLTGQESYLARRALRFARWTPYRPGWDHDHCDFCWAEISEGSSGQADFSEAWVTADDEYTWVCPNCFDDFQERFGWVVVDPSDSSSSGATAAQDRNRPGRLSTVLGVRSRIPRRGNR